MWLAPLTNYHSESFERQISACRHPERIENGSSCAVLQVSVASLFGSDYISACRLFQLVTFCYRGYMQSQFTDFQRRKWKCSFSLIVHVSPLLMHLERVPLQGDWEKLYCWSLSIEYSVNVLVELRTSKISGSWLEAEIWAEMTMSTSRPCSLKNWTTDLLDLVEE